MHKHIEKTKLDEKLQEVFGPNAYSEGPLATSGAGRRYVGVASNFSGPIKEGEPVSLSPGGDWHVDIECERLPIYVSMLLAHRSPVSRDAPGGTWVEAPDDIERFGSLQENPDGELMRLRSQLPLNGGTAFADTEGAFADLPKSEQEKLERTRVHRRLNWQDEGWLTPIVRINPRSDLKSLHSPIWNSRPAIKPPVLVEGMDAAESRAYLDQLEKHVLQSQFRYDHTHTPGDVTIWDNYMTLHNSPPIKTNIQSIDDARLLYRLSCKGEPALTLPRNDAQEWLDQHISGGYITPEEIIHIC